MLIPDPLLEEAAFISAAVREGSLSARRIAALVHARAGEYAAWPTSNLDILLQDADTVDRSVARGAALPLAGVPFVAVSPLPEELLHAFRRAGALRVEPAAAGGLALQGAAGAVTRGIAALALVAGAAESDLARCGTHALLPANLGCAFLARSSRDLALAASAVVAAESGGDVLCRPLMDAVGQGASALRIGVRREDERCILPESLRAAARLADRGKVETFDAIIFTGAPIANATHASRLYVPAHGAPAGVIGIYSSVIAIAVRVGAVLDAARLAGG